MDKIKDQMIQNHDSKINFDFKIKNSFLKLQKLPKEST